MKRNKFYSDLESATELENLVANEYRKFGYDVEMAPYCRFSDYDFIVKKGNIEERVEVKCDYTCFTGRMTGNLCIEYMNGCSKSGVLAGKEDDLFLQLFKTNEEEGLYYYILASKKEIYDFCVSNHHSVVRGERQSKCFLIRIDKVINRFGLKTKKLCRI